jgi:hypothetical protein
MKAFYLMIASALISTTVLANTVDQRLQEYTTQGGKNYSADAGKNMWSREFKSAEDGKLRACTTCHSGDLRTTGKHAVTGKVIQPMSPAVNKERLTDAEKIEKWFGRNCKWTYGRECTAQEKGDFLKFIQSQ